MMFQYREIEESTFCVNGTVDYDLLLFVSQNVIEELLCKNGGAAFRHDRMICVSVSRWKRLMYSISC